MNKLFLSFIGCLLFSSSYSQDTIKILSEQRVIIPITINDSEEYILVDTGSTLNIINSNDLKRLKLNKGFLIGVLESKYSKDDLYSLKNCKSFIGTKQYMQYGTSDISNAVKAILIDTDIKIAGILGTPAIKELGMVIDLRRGIVTLNK